MNSGTELVGNSYGDVDRTVSIQKTWFLKYNIVLIAFACTFFVHVDSLIQSIKQLRQNWRSLLLWMSIVQSALGVACHTSRLTDFFFITNCFFKPYLQITTVWLSLSLMDIIVASRDTYKLCQLGASRFIMKIYWVIMAIGFTICKGVFMLRTIITIQGDMGILAICGFKYNLSYFYTAMYFWIAFHCITLIVHIIILVVHFRQESPSKSFRDRLDNPTLLLIGSDITTLILTNLRVLPSLTLGFPDLVQQIMWALKSKWTVLMIDSPSTQKWLARKDSKVYSNEKSDLEINLFVQGFYTAGQSFDHTNLSHH